MSGRLPTSVQVLRDRGPLSLREVTAETAIRLGVDTHYDDVDAVLRVAADRGEVVRVAAGGDFRNHIWRFREERECVEP